MKAPSKFALRKEKQMKTVSRLFTVLTVMSLMLFFVGIAMAQSKYPVPQTVKDWVSQGKFMKFEGREKGQTHDLFDIIARTNSLVRTGAWLAEQASLIRPDKFQA